MSIKLEELKEKIDEIELPKFKEDEAVIYRNGDSYEIGIITQVILDRKPVRQHLRQDGLNGEPTGPVAMVDNYVYRVLYSMGSTSALTNEVDLHKIVNLNCFDIKRKEL